MIFEQLEEPKLDFFFDGVCLDGREKSRFPCTQQPGMYYSGDVVYSVLRRLVFSVFEVETLR
jgi:hypothetical protein